MNNWSISFAWLCAALMVASVAACEAKRTTPQMICAQGRGEWDSLAYTCRWKSHS